MTTTTLPPLEMLLALVELIKAARKYLDHPAVVPLPDADYHWRLARLRDAVEVLEGQR